MKVILLASAALALSACASAPYVSPSGGQASAQISFDVDADPLLGYTAAFFELQEFNGRNCSGPTTRMANINVGNPFDIKTNNPREILIAADEPFSMLVIFAPANLLGQRGCREGVSFTPAAGASYLLETKWDRSCEIKLFQLESSGKRVARMIQQTVSC